MASDEFIVHHCDGLNICTIIEIPILYSLQVLCKRFVRGFLVYYFFAKICWSPLLSLLFFFSADSLSGYCPGNLADQLQIFFLISRPLLICLVTHLLPSYSLLPFLIWEGLLPDIH